jgi:hypothetical protein
MLLVALITYVEKVMKLLDESLEHDADLVDGFSTVHLIFFVNENFLSSFAHLCFDLSLPLLFL